MSFLLVKQLVENKEYTPALQNLTPLMDANPDDPLGLFLFGQIMLATDQPAIAYMTYRRVTQLDPKRPEGWLNYGKAAGELHKYDLEEKYFKKALNLSKEGDISTYLATRNLATAATHTCNPDKVIHWANKALKIKDNSQSHIDLGFAYLMKHDFDNGWREYEYGNGVHRHRSIKQYHNEPVWNGEKDKTLVIYGEQGLGDQICMAEAVTDARRRSNHVILDVNPKLKGLFERSFLVETHGYDKEWTTDREITASCSMSTLQRILRSDGYSGKPYLVADPRRRIQWRALLDSLGKGMKVGIAWTGGVHDTQKDDRSTTLKELLPILSCGTSLDIDWIGLEYNDRSEEINNFTSETGVKIHDFSWATRTNDYDDTAALVQELDLVITVPTSVVHLAGGLGVPCWCIVHPYPHFMFGLEGDSMPYYSSIKLYRREKGWSVINKIGEKLNEMRLNEMRSDNPGGNGARTNSSSSSGVSKGGILKQGTVLHNQYSGY